MNDNLKFKLATLPIENVKSNANITNLESSTIKDSKSILVIIPLGYTKDRFFSLGNLLVYNGFKVYFLELQNNIGGVGEIYNADLNIQVKDIRSALEIVKCDIIVSMGIIVTATIKACDVLPHFYKHIFILPKFGIIPFIQRVIGQKGFDVFDIDHIGDFDFLGYKISSFFLETYLKNNLKDLENIINNTHSIKKWNIKIIGEIKEIEKDIFKKYGIGNIDFIAIPYINQNFDKNPLVAFKLFEAIVIESLKLFNINTDRFKNLTLKEIIKLKNNINI